LATFNTAISFNSVMTRYKSFTMHDVIAASP